MRSGRPLFFTSTISPLQFLSFVIASCSLVLFILLQLHNQSQAEYLIYFDYWRNFAAWRNNDIPVFFFHNVHTWAVISAVWFLDVFLAAGNLKLLHAYVIAANVLAFCSIFFILRRADEDAHRPLFVTVIPVIAVAALWLSPSNSNSFIYPGVDVLAATTFLIIILSEILYRWNEESCFTSPRRLIVYTIALLLGFLTCETYLVVPLFYSLDARLRGRIREFVSTASVFATLSLTYMFCLMLGLFNGMNMEAARAPLVIAHNFLFLLSSHFAFLLAESGLSQRMVANLSICVSIIQMSCFLCFAAFSYLQSTQKRFSLRFTFALASFALTAVFMATWLRFGNPNIYDPVERYTWYSELFSIAVFLQATDLWKVSKNRVCEAASIVIVMMCVTYLLGEQVALLLRSHNVGASILNGRLEMAAYAAAPGNELPIGPVEPDGGAAFRANLYGFLKERALSVFGSAGYESVGTKLTDNSDSTSHSRCMRIADTISTRKDAILHFMSFEGVDDDGIFVVTDRNDVITSFSFARRATPFDHTVVALLPAPEHGEQAVYFARFRSGREIAAVRCR